MHTDSSLTGPRYRLAQCALAKGLTETARAYLIAELELDPDDADALVSMGSMFLAMNDYEYAMHCMLRAVGLDNANAEAYYYLGSISFAKEEFEDAAEFFGHVLDINPNHVWALRDSALVYLAMGNTAEAAQRIKRARSLAAHDSHFKWLDRRIRIHHAFTRLKNLMTRRLL
jgi:tetratricopeptide (TPR) repeat protein